MVADLFPQFAYSMRFQDWSRTIVDQVHEFFLWVARFMGYPNNPGMSEYTTLNYYGKDFLEKSRLFRFSKSAPVMPENLREILFGTFPKVNLIEKTYYDDPVDGFYNFYVQEYTNNLYFPDPISEFIQVYCGLSDDISTLELIRELVFFSLLVFMELVNVRYTLFWFININPYVAPVSFLTIMVDWFEDSIGQLAPAVGGTSTVSLLLSAIVGLLMDILNNIIFTMPYLPSEGVTDTLNIKGVERNITIFKGLPELWRKYPIPNDLREYWYYQRPDILKYMQTRYDDENIQFLPDNILEKMQASQNIANINIQPDVIMNKIDNIKNLTFPSEIINLLHVPSINILENFHFH